MTEEVFNAQDDDNVTITVGNNSETVEAPVDVSTLDSVARENGVKKYTVKDADTGDSLSSDDFPYSSNLKIEEYNENA